jgi:hypothetical protein
MYFQRGMVKQTLKLGLVAKEKVCMSREQHL